MKTIGCSIAIRNAIEYDFCISECIRSVAPVCDEILVADSDSTDGTMDLLLSLAVQIPQLKILNYPHEEPNNDGLYVMRWTNWIRERLSTDYNFQIDADEVLHESCYGNFRERLQGPEVSLLVQRWNFWIDAQTMVPFGELCGHEVLRVAPKRHWLPADVPLPQGQDAMNLQVDARDIQIFHYGFLRKPEAFFKKEKFLQTAFTGGYDPHLDRLEDRKHDFMKERVDQFHGRPLEKFLGTHPAVAHQWLLDRGYQP